MFRICSFFLFVFTLAGEPADWIWSARYVITEDAQRRVVENGAVAIRGDRDTAEFADALGNGFEHGHALGAHGEPVGRVLDVAAGMDAAVGILNCRADPEFGIRREGVFAGGKRGIQQCIGSVGQGYASSLGSKAFKNRTSVSRTMTPVSSTSS